jgi:HEPN domain-containing protein
MSEAEHLVEARRWLRYAREDLEGAERLLDQAASAPRHVCLLAQQAAEKALKAVLIFLQIEYPYTHNLNVLRNLVPEGWNLKEENPDLAALTAWAIEARYPGDWPEATAADARTAVLQARAVWTSVLRDLADHRFVSGETP